MKVGRLFYVEFVATLSEAVTLTFPTASPIELLDTQPEGWAEKLGQYLLVSRKQLQEGGSGASYRGGSTKLHSELSGFSV
ncbi:hypothetical protein [Sneathiella sp.]|uniref:hypothetical protein n=1 Tax=Sneathiella sp. TaxID=1964365 RepID=UPI003565B160